MRSCEKTKKTSDRTTLLDVPISVPASWAINNRRAIGRVIGVRLCRIRQVNRVFAVLSAVHHERDRRLARPPPCAVDCEKGIECIGESVIVIIRDGEQG